MLGPGGLVQAALPGWEPRPQQLEMAEAVARALAEREPLLIEAGTGTGKTLGYLVPALLSGLKVIVSTGTKTLQEQILAKEVPRLERCLPFAPRVAVLKGISNYICRRRLRECRSLGLALGGGDGSLGSGLDRLLAWAESTATGDRAELADLPDDAPLWLEVAAASEARLGARCPCFEDCFVTQARRRAAAADVIVVNHHLFFADLGLRAVWPEAQLLPRYEAVVFDEAHQLEEVATDHLSTSVSSLRLTSLVRDLRRAMNGGLLDARREPALVHVERVGECLFSTLRARLPRDGRAPIGEDTWQGEATRDWHKLDSGLEEIEAALAGSAAPTPEGTLELGRLADRARSFRNDLAFVAEASDRRRVYWGERRAKQVMLRASPVEIADFVRQQLVAPVEALVFTSATLTTGGSFDYLRARLGLDEARELRLPSPFDYEAQALFYLPADLPDPAAPDFAPAIAERMARLVEASQGRAFLLFTSHRQMQAVARLLHGRIAGPMLIQGDQPKAVLLERFRQRPSVLFATASFWEGVDVVGEALILVVIDKLPFLPPDDPLVAARLRQLEDEGLDPFAHYQIPQAALALAQGFGRLIRHRTDYGVVALLDRRAATRSYGPRVLASLPEGCRRTEHLDDVCLFFAEKRTAAWMKTGGASQA